MRFLMLNWRDPKNPLAGGAERVTLGYLGALRNRGHEVFWFTYGFANALPEEDIEGIRIIRAGGFGTAIFQAYRWYRHHGPFDLVIDQHHGIPWFAPWWCQTNCVAYIHEVLGPIWKSFYPWPIHVFGRWQEVGTHWLYKKVPFWTANESTKRSLLERRVRDVTVIPYGVDTVALPELHEKPLEQPLKLIVVSRLAPNKRIDHAIRTLSRLLATGIQADLTIIGAGEEEGRLRRLAIQMRLQNQVVFTGSLSEKEKDMRLQQAHLLLHTSIREGWGLNVIEANALGTPAVVYPVGGLLESTIHSETGLVAECETPEALAASITELVLHPEEYQRYRRNAWERARTFHWKQVLPRACEWLETRARGRTES